MNRIVIVNAKQGQKNAKRAIELAGKWLVAGHDAEKVAIGIWNRFGFAADVIGDTLVIWGIADIKIDQGMTK